MNFGLDDRIINKIRNLFSNHTDITEVVIYGSRAKGNYKPGSDIDLTLKGKNLNAELLNKLTNEIDELMIPYTVDLSLFEDIDNESLIEHIERIGKVFYSK